MSRYDLAKMLAEIKLDERVRGGESKGKILTQDEIRARARDRRRKPASPKADPR